MECLILTYGRDFEPMAEIFFRFLYDFGISGYVHVLAQCALQAGRQAQYMHVLRVGLVGISTFLDSFFSSNKCCLAFSSDLIC